MNDFHFLRPEWFWLLLPIAILVVWLWGRQLRSRSWQAVCDPQLLPHLLLGRSQRRQNWPLYLIILTLFLSVFAASGPTWQRQPQPLFRQQSALVLIFDLSASMQAADLKPSRLVRARLKIADILQQRREGQTALVVFAGEAFTVTPLTDDSKTIAALLESLEPGLMPVFGSHPELALERGRRLLQQAGHAEGQLLLITDDDQPEAALEAAKELQQSGYQLSVLGVGTPEGAPIPLAGGGFFKDRAGQLVLPQLKPAALQQLAQAGGGRYQTIRVDDADLKQLLATSLTDRLEGDQRSERLGDDWNDMGGWLLWPVALLVAGAFRRGWLLIFLCFILQPVPAQAVDWQQLWQRSDQSAAKSFAEEDFSRAAEQFADPRWQASARYRNGQYDEAAELLANPENADDWYNRGNALAKSGRLPEALQAYAEALKIDPQHQDAAANQKLLEEALEQQPPPQEQQNSDQQQGDGQQDQSGSPEKSEEQPQDSQAGESSDSEQGESQPQDADTAPQQKEQQNAAAQPTQEQQEDPSDPQEGITSAAAADEAQTDKERADQQWLERIPDDPGGLLRRKFLYQYRQRDGRQTSDKPW